MRSDKNEWSAVVKVFGWLLTLATTLRKLAAQQEVPFEAFLRLTTEKGEATLRGIVELVCADYRASLPRPLMLRGGANYRDAATVQLEPGHYLIRVNRDPVSLKAETEREFSRNEASNLLTNLSNGTWRWRKDRSRLGANDISDELVEVLVKKFTDDEIREIGGVLDDDSIIQWGNDHGWLPADVMECCAVGIDSQTRHLRLESSLMALGSRAVVGGRKCVAFLSGGKNDAQRLGPYAFDGGWRAGSQFLFVRKVSK